MAAYVRRGLGRIGHTRLCSRKNSSLHALGLTRNSKTVISNNKQVELFLDTVTDNPQNNVKPALKELCCCSSSSDSARSHCPPFSHAEMAAP